MSSADSEEETEEKTGKKAKKSSKEKDQKKIPKKHLGLIIFNGVLGLGFLALLVMTLTTGGQQAENAYSNAKKLSINIKTGTIKGAPGTAKYDPSVKDGTDILEQKKAEEADLMDEFAAAEDEFAESEFAAMSEEESQISAEEEALEAIPAHPRTAVSLGTAPHPELIEPSEWGDIPKTGTIGSPKGYYARQSNVPAGYAQVAIVVMGLGQSKASTEKALSLPPDISLTFTPYAKFSPQWVKSARNLGHETWLSVPAQPSDFPASDPGPLSLLKDVPPEGNMERLHRLFAKFPGFVGVTLPIDEVFSKSRPHAEWFIKEVTGRGIAVLLPNNEVGGVVVKKALQDQSDSVIQASAIIDKIPTASAIASQLNRLENNAKREGKVLAVIRPYPASLEAIDAWSKTLAKKRIALVPATTLLRK